MLCLTYNSRNFKEPETIKLETDTSLAFRPKDHFYALVDYEDPYVQPLIISALEKTIPKLSYTILTPQTLTTDSSQSEIALASLLPAPDSRVLQISPYESIDWDFVASHESTSLVNSYMLRKALIRKHYLGSTIENWVAKRPNSILKTHVQRGEAFELDYAEFLDDALVDAFDLNASFERNAETQNEEEKEWWILKPGMSDRGQGIRLFNSMEELQGIFEEWEEDMPDSDEEDEAEDGVNDGAARVQSGSTSKQQAGDEDECDGIMTSHLRHFVAQPYIHPPLLLPGTGDRKFHIRTYVLCAGSLDVYVYRDMLALFASKAYAAPWGQGGEDLEAHLTNTCLQRSVSDGTVRKFWDLELPQSTSGPSKEDIFEQICGITGEVFEAAARGMMMHFQPLPNAFEVYGLDFLVDAKGTAWLLEVNAFPDFKQTGDDLKQLVEGLWEGIMTVAVGRFFGTGGNPEDSKKPQREAEKMVHVREVDLGRRWGSS